MHAYQIYSGRGDNALERITRSPSALGPHEVRIAVSAVSLNYRDLMIARGNYPVSGENPPIAVADGAGEVIAVGSDVTRFRTGDRVVGSYFSRWLDGEASPDKIALVPGATIDGFLAEQATFNEEYVVRAAANLSLEEASTLPCAGVTAWNALFVEGRVKPGSTILLQGTGGVSIWALQLAKAAGLRVIITSSSDVKLERARALGADATINYRTQPEWQNEALRLTQGRGVDLVVEIGGHGSLNRSVTATRTGGTIAVVGGVNGFGSELEIIPLLVGSKRLIGITVGSRAMLEDLNSFVEHARIQPVIDRVFDFDRAREAYAYLEAAKHFGKVVIRINPR